MKAERTALLDLSERRGGGSHRHPWETARASFLIDLLQRKGELAAARDWLDVGAGDGWLTAELAAVSPLGSHFTCWDIHLDDDPDVTLPGASHGDISFTREQPDGVFDALLMLDVIEHVEDDTAFVGQLVTDRLQPGGTALVTVPAWQPLFSHHDVALRHHRRYSPGQARRVLHEGGLQIRTEGGLFHSLLLPRALQVLGERFGRPAPDRGIGAWDSGRAVTRSLDTALRLDGRVSAWLGDRHWRVPGLSYWALCSKR